MSKGIWERTIKGKCLICEKPLTKGRRKVCSNSCRYVLKGIQNKDKGNKPPSRKGKPWPPGQYEKFKEKMSGECNPNWRGGIGRHRSKTKEYYEWQRAVFERDNYTCQECKKRGVRLNAHHVKGWKDHLELRYDVDNGLTLCVLCHQKTPQWGQRGRNRNMDKVGALWKRVSKKGEDFFTGIVGGQSVVIFKNNRKNKPNQPDYEVFKGQDRTELPPKDQTEEEVPF